MDSGPLTPPPPLTSFAFKQTIQIKDTCSVRVNSGDLCPSINSDTSDPLAFHLSGQQKCPPPSSVPIDVENKKINSALIYYRGRG